MLGQEDDVQLRPRPNQANGSLWRALPTAAALVAVGLMAAACGGSPGVSVASLGSSSTTTTPLANTGSSLAGGGGGGGTAGNSGRSTIGLGGITVQFALCMRSHGVANFPDPDARGQVQLSGVNPTSPSFEAAQRACAKYSPGGGKPPSAAQQQKAIAGALKFSQCMRNHGITDFPDPQVSSSGGRVGIRISLKASRGSDLNPNSPQFQAAQKACQSLMPGGAKARSGATSSGP